MTDLDRLRKDAVLDLSDHGFPLAAERLRRRWKDLLALQVVDDAVVDVGTLPAGALLATRILPRGRAGGGDAE